MGKKKSSSKKIAKKQARQAVYDQLVVALAGFKSGTKDKKFESNLRKASKLFATDIAKSNGNAKAKVPKTGTNNIKITTDKKEELHDVS